MRECPRPEAVSVVQLTPVRECPHSVLVRGVDGREGLAWQPGQEGERSRFQQLLSPGAWAASGGRPRLVARVWAEAVWQSVG